MDDPPPPNAPPNLQPGNANMFNEAQNAFLQSRNMTPPTLGDRPILGRPELRPLGPTGDIPPLGSDLDLGPTGSMGGRRSRRRR